MKTNQKDGTGNHLSKNGTISNSSSVRRIQKSLFLLTVVCIAALLLSSCRASQRTIAESKPCQIEGVWRQVPPPGFVGMPGGEEIKIFTNGRFILTWTHNNVIVASFGGTYTFDGTTLTEHIKFATPNRTANLGVVGVINVRFEGNRKYIQGGLDGGWTFNEIWERVE